MKLITTPRRMIRQEVVQILVAVAEQIRWLSRKTRKFSFEMLYGYYFISPCRVGRNQGNDGWTCYIGPKEFYPWLRWVYGQINSTAIGSYTTGMYLSALSYSWIINEDSMGHRSADKALPYWSLVSPIVSLHGSEQLTRIYGNIRGPCRKAWTSPWCRKPPSLVVSLVPGATKQSTKSPITFSPAPAPRSTATIAPCC